jgi:hypothetical protein
MIVSSICVETHFSVASFRLLRLVIIPLFISCSFRDTHPTQHTYIHAPPLVVVTIATMGTESQNKDVLARKARVQVLADREAERARKSRLEGLLNQKLVVSRV